MEKIVEELKGMIKFKNSTDIGDIGLLLIDNPRTLLYARVGAIERDTSRRDEWWRISLQLLTVPPQEVQWTLRPEQFTGQEIFTMGGDKRFFQAVDLDVVPVKPPRDDGSSGEKENKIKPKLKLIS